MVLSERRRHSGLYSRTTAINALRFLWTVIIIWCELGAFFWSLRSCRWPDKEFQRFPGDAPPAHVMVIADPHFRDSKAVQGSSSWLTSISETLHQLNLRKSWNAASRLNPQLVIFLGDMLHKGRSIMTDDQYAAYHRRFQETFKHDHKVPVYFITGNHDVGLGTHRSFSSQSRRRFRQRFGAEQQQFEFGNHTFVAVDAPGLVDEDYRRYAEEADYDSWQGTKAGPISFVKGLRMNPPPEDRPTILLTHIPLARPESASCGPDRQERAKGIRRGAGYGYQNLLGRQTTHFILQAVDPVLVLSGDDHDYCDYIHRYASADDDVREITVRTFAAGQGISRPGFQLLSLYTPSDGSPLRNDMPCLLPDQSKLYSLGYLPALILSLVWLSYVNLRLLPPPKVRDLAPSRPDFTVEPPPTPSHLSVRRISSVGGFPMPLTPRSRPSSPRPSVTTFEFGDDAMLAPHTPRTPRSPFPPSPFLQTTFTDEPDDIEEVSAPMLNPPSSQNGKRRKKGESKDQITLVERLMDLWHFYGGRSGKEKERILVRVGKDLAQVAWPPGLFVAFVWWRLLSW